MNSTCERSVVFFYVANTFASVFVVIININHYEHFQHIVMLYIVKGVPAWYELQLIWFNPALGFQLHHGMSTKCWEKAQSDQIINVSTFSFTELKVFQVSAWFVC